MGVMLNPYGEPRDGNWPGIPSGSRPASWWAWSTCPCATRSPA